MCSVLIGGTTTTMTATATVATTMEIGTTDMEIGTTEIGITEIATTEIRTLTVTAIAATVRAPTLDDYRARRGEIAALGIPRPRGTYRSKPDGRELTVTKHLT